MSDTASSNPVRHELDDAIRRQIDNGEIHALSLDTCIFDENGLVLESGLLEQVARIQSCGVTVVLSDVIVNEVKAHLQRNARDTAAKLEGAIREARRRRFLSAAALTQIEHLTKGPVAEAVDHASQRLQDWLKHANVEVVDVDDHVQVGQLTERYFNGEAPFGANGPKKQEFPDAIALLSLSGWADEHNTKVLAVSSDGDWQRYGADTDNVVVTADLAAALSAFQTPTAASASRALFKSLSDGDPLGLEDKLLDALNTQDAIDFDIEATSQSAITNSEAHPEFKEVEFPDPDAGAGDFEPVGLSDDEAVVRITASACAEVTCYLRFAKRDSISRETLSMGSAKIAVDEEVEIQALVTLGGQIPDNMMIKRVEILPQTVDLELDAEPDWMINLESLE